MQVTSASSWRQLL